MKRNLVASLALLCCALVAPIVARAQANITVFHVFSPSATTYLTTLGKSPSDYINKQITDSASVLIGSGANFQFLTPSNPQFLVISTVSTTYNAAAQIAMDQGVAHWRDSTGSDVVVVVTDMGTQADENGTVPSTSAAFSETSKFLDSPVATVVVNVRASMEAPNTYSWLHQVLDHVMHAGHQRLDGGADPPNNRGANIGQGNDEATCVVLIDVTSSRVKWNKTYKVPVCNGWGLDSPGPGQVGFYCQSKGWCDAYAQTATGQNGTNYTNYTGAISGSGTGLTCTVSGTQPGGAIVNVSSAQIGLPRTGVFGLFTCQNPPKLVPRISGINVLDPVTGVHMGSQFENNIDYLNSISTSIAQRHTVPRVPATSFYRSCMLGQGPCL